MYDYSITTPYSSGERSTTFTVSELVGSYPGPPIAPEQTWGAGGSRTSLAERTTVFRSDPVNTATGAFSTSVLDASMPVVGVPLELNRTYNSLDITSGVLGVGWTHDLAASLSVEVSGDIVVRSGDGQQLRFDVQPDGSLSPAPGAVTTLLEVPGGYEVGFRNGHRWVFNAEGRLMGWLDRNGQGLTLAYGASGELESVTGGNRSLVLTYSGGLLAQVTLPDGRHVDYSYAGGLLESVTGANGGITSYGYDSGGRLSSITDPVGSVVVTNIYDPFYPRVTEQLDAMGIPSYFSWNGTTGTATTTDNRGNKWIDVYENNVLIKTVDPLLNTTIHERNADARLEKVIDSRGNATTMTYDAAGNMTSRAAPQPFGYVETWAWTGFQLDSHTNARQLTTSYTYDASGNLYQVVEPSGVTSTSTQDPATGLVTAVTDPRGSTTTLTYDVEGNRVQSTDPEGGVTTFTYDQAGRLTSIVEPRGNLGGADPDDFRTSIGYDAGDHVVSVVDPLGNATVSQYDLAGNLVSITDPNENGATTGYVYDVRSRLTGVCFDSGTCAGSTDYISYAYDAVGNRLTQTQPTGTTTYSYNTADQLLGQTGPGGVISYTYDESGNLTGDGVTSYTYDAANRMSSVAQPAMFDPYQQIVVADSPVAYWRLGESGGSLAADVLGAHDGSYQGGTSLGQTGLLVDDPDSAAGFDGSDDFVDVGTLPIAGSSFTLESWIAASTSPPKTQTVIGTHGGNQAGRSVNLRVHDDGRLGLNFGNNELTSPTGTVSFGDTHHVVATYDSATDTTSLYVDGAVVASGDQGPFTYAGNEFYVGRYKDHNKKGEYFDGILDDVAVYDHTLSSTDVAAHFEAGMRLPVVTTYAYDGDGVRLRATAPGSATDYVWDSSGEIASLALERDSAGQVVRRYVNGVSPLSVTTASGEYWYHTDWIGSVIAITDDTGTPQWSYEYEPYGVRRSATQHQPTAPDNPVGFTGGYEDPTGLYHLGARQYDPATGRFTSTDPLQQPDTQPWSTTYGYVDGRPTTLVDPTGLCWWTLGDGGCPGAGAFDVTVAAVNAPVTLGAVSWATVLGGDCRWDQHLTVVCDVDPWANGPRPWITIGNTILVDDREFFDRDGFAHESNHRSQWLIGHVTFPITYGLNEGVSQLFTGTSCLNVFEWMAGFESGEYRECVAPASPGSGAPTSARGAKNGMP